MPFYRKPLLKFLSLAIFLAILPVFSFAEEEKILLFSSRITVNADSTLKVEETINVRALGVKIRRGIYRDFPTIYQDSLGNTHKVSFNVQQVLRNGSSERFHYAYQANGIRVYIGDKKVFLPEGEYTYTLVYTTDRQLGFFTDHDELYWNVTGNGWEFPIEKAQATVQLPGIGFEQLRLDAYTGFKGERGQDFKVSDDGQGNALFETTRPMQANEGLTIAVGWPKGFVKAPTQQDKLNDLLRDNKGIIAGTIGILLLLFYYLAVWSRFGKDPAKGTIIPLYEPPSGLSPQACRYVLKMGFDQRCFTACILNMAVKGYLTIEEKQAQFSLKRSENPKGVTLTQEETNVATLLFGGNDSVVLAQDNHSQISQSIGKLKHYLKGIYENNYFFTNIRYFIPGLAISLLTAIVALPMQQPQRFPIAVFMIIWLSIWTIGVTALFVSLCRSWQSVAQNILAVFPAIFLTLFSLPFFAGEIFGICILAYATSLYVMLILITMIGLNILFYYLLKAPTLAGRNIMDRIEGFKMYLSVAEKGRFNTLYPVEQTPELFEKYLPYAFALDVEQAWTNRFSRVLEVSSQGKNGYSPSWYSGGRAFTSLGAAAFVSSLGNSLSGAISSSAHAPGSSSGGGGGGSSGGGGGGGGGGGW